MLVMQQLSEGIVRLSGRAGVCCNVSFSTQPTCRAGRSTQPWGAPRRSAHAACIRLCRSQQHDRVPCDTTARASSDGQPQCLPEEDGSVLVRDDLDALLEVLPPDIRGPLVGHPQRSSLLEVVLDLGRRPEARFLGVMGGEYLRDEEITWEDLKAAEEAVGEFGGDNRAGVQGTLHRISALRNRKGTVVGLTCRVGRAVTGHMDMIRDMIEVPHSLLFLGRPGVGKTTVIREMARVLSDDLHKRVVIVDTSNEIGGDGDVPHPAIGGARRMQVPDPSQQHRVMVEAVENHMPEVVIVDEIGTEAEALACRSIAERGVQLVGTAHGQLLENLIKNPTLSDLIGGICSVTLGDEEARARGTQKSILERKAPPTFPLVIEMRERACWVTHWVEDSVDCLLHGKDPVVQLRRRQPGVKDVVVEEQRYDSLAATGVSADSLAPPFETMAPSRPEPAGLPAVDPAVAAVEEALLGIAPPDGPAFGATFNASDPDDPYAWAQRLKNIPDKDALQELAYASSRGGGHVVNGVPHSSGRRAAKFTFTQGTGGGGGKRNSTRRSAGDGNRRRS